MSPLLPRGRPVPSPRDRSGGLTVALGGRHDDGRSEPILRLARLSRQATAGSGSRPSMRNIVGTVVGGEKR